MQSSCGHTVQLARVENTFMLFCMPKKPSNFTAIIYPDAESDWLVAYNPETGTATQGKTFEEALTNLKEATELYLTEFPAS